MKIDQLNQTQPADKKNKKQFLKMEIERTTKTIRNMFPDEIVSQIINMATAARNIHKGILNLA